MRCPASLALEQGCPDSSSEFADEGTAAHELASMALTENLDADAYIGRVIEVGERSFTVDDDMAGYVQVYIDHVRSLADGGQLFVEQRVDFSRAVGVADSFGTSDAIILKGDEIILVDLKYGRGVKVDADENEQMLLYGIGALDSFGLAYDFRTVRMVICQPRLDWISEWSCDMGYVCDFAGGAAVQAASAIYLLNKPEALDDVPLGKPHFNPGDKQCRFCKAKAICPALEREVQDAVLGSFEDLTAKAVAVATDNLQHVFSQALGRRMDAVELVEMWCKAVRARAEAELLQGRRVDGWKLVEGRKGQRKWRDEKAVEDALKAMRLKTDEIYDRKLISPATAEKRLKGNPRRWAAVQAFIGQDAGKPSVAPESDKRPAISVADDFVDLTATAASGPEQHPFRQ